MRGETSQLSDRLARDHFAASLEQLGDGSLTVGKELFELCSLLDNNPALEDKLTDPSRSDDERAALARRILDEAHAQPLTHEIIDDLVRRPWSQFSDIANAVEDFGVDAMMYAADARGTTKIIALELAWLRSSILNLPQVRTNLSDQTVDSSLRVKFYDTIFGNSGLHEISDMLARHATQDLRNRRYADTLSWMIVKLGHHLRERVVSVTSAVALSEEQIARIKRIYAAKLNHKVHVNVIVDPKVMGGLRIRSGRDVTDTTVAGQLNNLRASFGAKA